MLRSYPFFEKAPDLLHDPSAFKRHYNPDQRSRYARGFVTRSGRLRQKGRVIYVDASGGGLLQMLGLGDWDSLVSVCLALLEKPQMVEDLVQRTTDFYCVCLKKVHPKVSADYASFYEPIAVNTGPVISPAMFKRFAIPGYRKVIDLLASYQIPPRILCTTGGDLTSFLPSLIDAGINGLWISNIRTARMEYPKIRRQFASEIVLIGGIDSAALARDEEAVEETVPDLLEGGHYLPCLDDRPRSNIPFAHYRLYRHILEEIAQGVITIRFLFGASPDFPNFMMVERFQREAALIDADIFPIRRLSAGQKSCDLSDLSCPRHGFHSGSFTPFS